MDFKFTEEQDIFRKTLRTFCKQTLATRSEEIDRQETIPDDILKEMAKMGLLGITIPQKYGGSGANLMNSTIAGIEIGRGDISMATAVFYLLEAGWSPILEKYGAESLKDELFPKIVKGEAFLGIASTEPSGGSDLANIKTVARREGDNYIINGAKAFISGVTEAQELGGGHLTLVKTEPDAGYRGMSFMYIPTNTPGISASKYENMGRMGISTCGMHYDNVEIPTEYLLGEENRGFKYIMEGFNVARTLVAAACIGAGEMGLEIGMEHIKQREAFGRPLGKFEGVQFELADLYARLEMVKWQVLRSAWLIDQEKKGEHSDVGETTRTVAIAKLEAPQIAFDIYKKVMMWYGAAGYTKEYGVERGFRGIMSYLSGAEGALNIMRVILGRELLGKEFMPYR